MEKQEADEIIESNEVQYDTGIFNRRINYR